MCPVGCGIEVHRNPGTNAVIKIHGDWDAAPTYGLLCKLGRYDSIYEEKKRIPFPYLRSKDKLSELTGGALEGEIRPRIQGASAYVDGTLTNEELDLVKKLFGDRVHAVNPVKAPLASTAGIGDLNTAGTIVVFRLDPDVEYGALGSLMKRRVMLNEAGLVLVDAPSGTFPMLACERMTSAEFLARSDLVNQDGCLFVYRDLEDREVQALAQAKGARLLWLPPETNTLGLAKLGIGQEPVQGDVLFFFGRDFPGVSIGEGAFVACFSPYENSLTRRADLVVPIKDSFEREGTFYNLEGQPVRRSAVLSSGPGTVDLKDMFSSMLKKG
jgi:formate dehydrogenase major subunit